MTGLKPKWLSYRQRNSYENQIPITNIIIEKNLILRSILFSFNDHAKNIPAKINYVLLYLVRHPPANTNDAYRRFLF